MKVKSSFYIKSKIELIFSNSKLARYAYNSFLPELNSRKNERSTIYLNLDNESLLIDIESKDITAFRASVNEIINLGKIIDGSLEIINSM